MLKRRFVASSPASPLHPRPAPPSPRPAGAPAPTQPSTECLGKARGIGNGPLPGWPAAHLPDSTATQLVVEDLLANSSPPPPPPPPPRLAPGLITPPPGLQADYRANSVGISLFPADLPTFGSTQKEPSNTSWTVRVGRPHERRSDPPPGPGPPSYTSPGRWSTPAMKKVSARPPRPPAQSAPPSW